MYSSCPAESPARSPHRRQRGVALITVLLLVAIATIAVVEIAGRQQFDLRRAEVRNGLEQARLIAVGAESVAIWTLSEDRKRGTVDALNEDWTQPVATELSGAEVSGQIVDLQGRFNLNNLFSGGQIDAVAMGRLQRLLQRLDLAPGLSEAIVDWIDPDAEASGAEGAEDGYYASLERPYRAANRPFSSVTELRLVRGVTEEVYAKLLPLVSTLPERTALNLNTAPADVIKALDGQIDEAAVDQWLEERTDPGGQVFEQVADFLRLAGLNGQSFDSSGLGVASDYFQMQALVQLGRVKYMVFSRIKRDANGVSQVQMRYRGMI